MRILAAAGILLVGALLFFWTGPTGDIVLFVRTLYLDKLHLWRDFNWPYFTPAICGGWLLAADPQNPIFTIYQALSPILSNQYHVIQLGNFLVTGAFAAGLYRWFGYFGITRKGARAAAAFITAISGWWMVHNQDGHLTFHAVAFLPWLFWGFERLLDPSTSTARLSRASLLRWSLFVATLVFLLVNSGQIWFQFAFLYFFGRTVVEAALVAVRVRSGRSFAVALGVFAFGAALALAMSAHRIAAILHYAVGHFPRDIAPLQIFGSLRYELVTILRAFFDPRIMSQHLSEPHLGGWWEWSAYLGIASAFPILLGLTRLRALARRPVFAGLVIAVIFQLLMCRYGPLVEAYRRYIPGTKNMSFYYRGVILIVLLAGLLIAHGFDELLARCRPKRGELAFGALVAVIVCELLFVYHQAGFLGVRDEHYRAEDFANYPAKVIGYADAQTISAKGEMEPLSQGLGEAGCYDPPLLGYTNEFYHTQVKPGPVLTGPKDAYDNVNDLRTIFGPQGTGGVFKSKAWPRWPKSNRQELDRFLSFEQVIAPPNWLLAVSWLSFFATALFLGILVAVTPAVTPLVQAVHRRRYERKNSGSKRNQQPH